MLFCLIRIIETTSLSNILKTVLRHKEMGDPCHLVLADNL